MPVRRADNLTIFMSRLSRDLTASNSWNGPVQYCDGIAYYAHTRTRQIPYKIWYS